MCKLTHVKSIIIKSDEDAEAEAASTLDSARHALPGSGPSRRPETFIRKGEAVARQLWKTCFLLLEVPCAPLKNLCHALCWVDAMHCFHGTFRAGSLQLHTLLPCAAWDGFPEHSAVRVAVVVEQLGGAFKPTMAACKKTAVSNIFCLCRARACATGDSQKTGSSCQPVGLKATATCPCWDETTWLTSDLSCEHRQHHLVMQEEPPSLKRDQAGVQLTFRYLEAIGSALLTLCSAEAQLKVFA